MSDIERLEREADEALDAVDPAFARELGYSPPGEATHKFMTRIWSAAFELPMTRNTKLFDPSVQQQAPLQNPYGAPNLQQPPHGTNGGMLNQIGKYFSPPI